MTNTTTAPRYKSSMPVQPAFITNADALGDCLFEQVQRDGKFAIYRRTKCETGKFFSYEVVTIKTVKAGAKLPGGSLVQSDYESYPGGQAFGKTAWEFKGKASAVAKFNELVARKDVDQNEAEVVESPVHIVAAVKAVIVKNAAPSQIPSGEFTQAQFAGVNNLPPRGTVWGVLHSLIGQGKIKESRRVQVGPGRPTCLYVGV